MEPLYSGEAMTKPSDASRRSLKFCAPDGKPTSDSSSASNDGESNSSIDARSTAPPLAAIVSTASSASFELREPVLIDAEKTRNRIGSRASVVIFLPRSGCRRADAGSNPAPRYPC